MKRYFVAIFAVFILLIYSSCVKKGEPNLGDSSSQSVSISQENTKTGYADVATPIGKPSTDSNPAVISDGGQASPSPGSSPFLQKTGTLRKGRYVPMPSPDEMVIETPVYYNTPTPDASQANPEATPASSPGQTDAPGKRKLNIDPKIPGAIR
jgi:hypothetical protein